jgi:hypothetical protein
MYIYCIQVYILPLVPLYFVDLVISHVLYKYCLTTEEQYSTRYCTVPVPFFLYTYIVCAVPGTGTVYTVPCTIQLNRKYCTRTSTVQVVSAFELLLYGTHMSYVVFPSTVLYSLVADCTNLYKYVVLCSFRPVSATRENEGRQGTTRNDKGLQKLLYTR